MHSVVSSRRMKRIAAATLVLCVLFGAGAVRGEQEPAPSITVVGSGTAAAPPDTAEVTAGVVTQAATAAQALTQNSSTMEQVLKAPVLFLGLSLPDHGYHAPNENFDWGQAEGGIVAFAKYFEEVSRIKSRRR